MPHISSTNFNKRPILAGMLLTLKSILYWRIDAFHMRRATSNKKCLIYKKMYATLKSIQLLETDPRSSFSHTLMLLLYYHWAVDSSACLTLMTSLKSAGLWYGLVLPVNGSNRIKEITSGNVCLPPLLNCASGHRCSRTESWPRVTEVFVKKSSGKAEDPSWRPSSWTTESGEQIIWNFVQILKSIWSGLNEGWTSRLYFVPLSCKNCKLKRR